MKDSPRILFLPKYERNGASSRYRIYQYLPWLERNGFVVEVEPLFDESYLNNSYLSGKKSLTDITRAFFRRIVSSSRARHFDLIVIEYELLPYFPEIFEGLFNWFKLPYVVDYDDALFHQYDGHKNPIIRALLGGKIASVMRRAALVIAGNQYLADYAICSHARAVEILPTVVDLERYPAPTQDSVAQNSFTVGWIGSPSTSKYIAAITQVLTEFCRQKKSLVRLIGATDGAFPDVSSEVFSWNEQTEVALLQSCGAGIMPLPDEPWTRGKCGFKLIQYMACGLPVIASPVGANEEIVEHGVNGFFANTSEEWMQALETICNDPELRKRMGAAGRRKVEEKYCLQVTAPRYVELLKSVLERR